MANTLPKYFLFAVIAVITLMLLREWNDFSQRYNAELSQRAVAQAGDQLSTLPPVHVAEDAIAANEELAVPVIEQAKSSVDPAQSQPTSFNSTRTITITTDTIRVAIDKLGGDILEVAMLKHLESLQENAPPLKLLEKNTLRTYTAQSGLIGDSGSNVKSARAMFNSESDSYTMQNGEPLDVELFFRDANGVVLKKVFSFTANEYLFGVAYNIDNLSDQPWRGRFYSQISRDNSEDPGTESAGFGMQSYLGTATTIEDSPYEKISFKDIEKNEFRLSRQGGWIAMIQHYFVSAWIPEQNQQQHYFTKKAKNSLNIIGFYSDPLEIQPGQSGNVGAQFYAGPKNQYRLAEIAEHLDLTIDYGWLWMLSQPLYALLHMFATGDLHAFGKIFHVFPGFHNWGLAIIMLTVVVKAVFFKLSAASYRSMANMRRVQPKLLALRERYANDKQGQSKAMMELYQKEKINPLGGCLPILIQMPVFIALYWALMESVELRHAPFMLWINDLSVMDPFFILPILMGATMWFQQKMNPAPPDPMQAKVMAWMPIIFTFFFLWFPAGLVVYWVSNNVLSILQQWVITRNIEKTG